MSDIPPDQRPQQGGVAVVLALGLAAALGGCVFVWYFVAESRQAAESLGIELSAVAQLYLSATLGAFALPVVTWLAAMAITRAGRQQRNLGLLLTAFLFGFALLWPAGAIVAFTPVYSQDAPEARSQQSAL